MKSHLFLVRHGETDWNRQELLQGHSDIELNDLGREQAGRLRPFAETLGIHTLVSSDLKRAVQTAMIAFQPTTELIIDARLREVHLGKAEGTNRHQLEKHFGSEILRAWVSFTPEDMHHRFPEGESRAEAMTRITECLKEITLKHGPGKYAFVTHGLVIRTLAQIVAGESRPEFRAPNCSVFEFSFDHLTHKFDFKTVHLLPVPWQRS